jgi:hypothetical protein
MALATGAWLAELGHEVARIELGAAEIAAVQRAD